MKRLPVEASEMDKLHDVDAPFAGLAFRHKGLRLPKPPGRFALR
jgi:hypothetical protein